MPLFYTYNQPSQSPTECVIKNNITATTFFSGRLSPFYETKDKDAILICPHQKILWDLFENISWARQ